MLVPYRHDDCGSSVTVDELVLAEMRLALESMLPVSDVELLVHAEVGFTGVGFPYDDLLAQLVSLRSAEGAPPDLFYYGYVYPCEFRDSGSCSGGLAYTTRDGVVVEPSFRAGVGGPRCGGGPWTTQHYTQTMVHELGHNLGMAHAPCDGTEPNADPSYPHSGGQIGVWGWNPKAGNMLPPTTPDIMSYCHPRWVSDYGWFRMRPQIEAVANGLALQEPGVPHLLLATRPDGTALVTELTLAASPVFDAWVDIPARGVRGLPGRRVEVADGDGEHILLAAPEIELREGEALTIRAETEYELTVSGVFDVDRLALEQPR